MNTYEQIADLAQERAALYRLLSTLYFKPLSNDQIEAIASSLQGDPVNVDSAFASAFQNMYAALRLRHTGTQEMLGADFTATFYGTKTIDERTAQPYESLYEPGNGQLMGKARGEVFRTFKAAALRIPEGIDLPEDHLSFIFTYLARLCDKQAEQAEARDTASLRQTTDDLRTFFAEHVQNWVPGYIEHASRFVETRFYRGVLELTDVFIREEGDTLEEMQAALSTC